MITCKCGNEFQERKINGMIVSKICPSCQYKNAISKKQENKAPWNRKTTERKKTSTQREKEMHNADKYFSLYIRHLFSTDGWCKCYTCGKIYGIKSIDAGHYISRDIKATRYDVRNVRPQCISCNRFKQGKHFEFEQALIKEIGVDEVNRLKEDAKITIKDNEEFYIEKKHIFMKLLKEIE